MPRSPEQARQLITAMVERIDRELLTTVVPDWAAVAVDSLGIFEVASEQRLSEAAA